MKVKGLLMVRSIIRRYRMKVKGLSILISIILVVLATGLAPFIGACAKPEPAPTAPTIELPGYLVSASRQLTTSFGVMHTALNSVWERELGIKCLFLTIGSTAEGIAAVREGRVHLLGAGYRDFRYAYHGMEAYEDVGKHDLRLMHQVKSVAMVFMTVPRTGVTKIEDFAGKRVSYRSATAIGPNQTGGGILEYYGLLDKIVDLPPITMEERVNGLNEGRVDVVFESITQVPLIRQKNPDVFVVPIPREACAYVEEKYPHYYWGIVPENYEMMGLPAISAIMSPMGTIASISLSESTVYQLLKCMYDNFDELLLAHPIFKDLTVDDVVDPKTVIPYHPGAVKYYSEQGVWTSEMDAIQEQLLAEQ